MELTRLRRYLREHKTLPITMAHDLLEEIDLVYEDAEYYEDMLKDKETPSDEDISIFIGENAERLTSALVRVMTLDIILQIMASVHGYDKMQETIGRLKVEWEEKEQQQAQLVRHDEHGQKG